MCLQASHPAELGEATRRAHNYQRLVQLQSFCLHEQACGGKRHLGQGSGVSGTSSMYRLLQLLQASAITSEKC